MPATDRWEERAKTYRWYVTNTSIHDIVSYHKLTLPHDSTVLVVGVGECLAIKQLVELGNIVYAADVSPTLLDLARVSGAKEAVLSREMSKLPPVDLAISHLVLQHNHEDEVIRIIADTQLSPGGMASYQYCTLVKPNISQTMMEELNLAEQHYLSPARMEQFIIVAGKKPLPEKIQPVEFRNNVDVLDWNFARFTLS